MPEQEYKVSAGESTTEETPAGPKPYLIPFQFAIRELGLHGDIPDQIQITREQLNAFITTLLRGVEIDEEWYLGQYPDIDQAITRGGIASAREHFVVHGYCEGRHPSPVKVDEKFYLQTYPDVAEGVECEEIRSAQEHFDNHGRSEGRLPFLTKDALPS